MGGWTISNRASPPTRSWAASGTFSVCIGVSHSLHPLLIQRVSQVLGVNSGKGGGEQLGEKPSLQIEAPQGCNDKR